MPAFDCRNYLEVRRRQSDPSARSVTLSREEPSVIDGTFLLGIILTIETWKAIFN